MIDKHLLKKLLQIQCFVKVISFKILLDYSIIYQWIKRSFSLKSFKLEFFSKLNWLLYYLLRLLTIQFRIQLNADDKMGSESQVVCHKTIRLIRTRSKGARTYAGKLSIVIWSINYHPILPLWMNQAKTIRLNLIKSVLTLFCHCS